MIANALVIVLVFSVHKELLTMNLGEERHILSSPSKNAYFILTDP